MQNLGYFQLKANPGVWQLRLAEGRAATLYNIVVGTESGEGGGGLQWMGGHGGGGSVEVIADTRQVVVKDFTGQP